MQATRSRLRSWVERGLAAGGHPSLDEIVTAGRSQDPPVSWFRLAADVSAKCGEPISLESLRQWYGAPSEGAA